MNQSAELYTRVISALHSRWRPHHGQIKIGRWLFNDHIRAIFGEIGRNWGKTELILYAFWRWSMFVPGSQNYYFGPTQELAHEIIWETKRLQTFGPSEWLSNVSEAEMKIGFTNGSYVKVDGSDNVGLNRGVKPKNGLIVYDEFKDFNPDFHNAFEPNIVPKEKVDGFGEDSNCTLMIFGTPPEKDGQFTEVADEFKANPSKRYYNGSSSENVYLTRSWLDEKKRELYAKGDGDVWEREYEAKRVRGGKRSIFPMLDKKIIKGHRELLFSLRRDMNKLAFYTIADPGTTSVFAVMFIAHNPYTNKVYFLDEIYETDPNKTTSRTIGPRILEIERDLCESAEWTRYCDEAAAWFIKEVWDACEIEFISSNKSAVTKEQGISHIKDALLMGLIEASDRCKMWYWEMENYVKDKNGKIPKGNDHTIDDTRYFFQAIGYQAKGDVEPEVETDDGRKVYRMRDEVSVDDYFLKEEIG